MTMMMMMILKTPKRSEVQTRSEMRTRRKSEITIGDAGVAEACMLCRVRDCNVASGDSDADSEDASDANSDDDSEDDSEDASDADSEDDSHADSMRRMQHQNRNHHRRRRRVSTTHARPTQSRRHR
jgi:hypothetical protein